MYFVGAKTYRKPIIMCVRKPTRTEIQLRYLQLTQPIPFDELICREHADIPFQNPLHFDDK